MYTIVTSFIGRNAKMVIVEMVDIFRLSERIKILAT